MMMGPEQSTRVCFFDNIRDFNPKSEINRKIIADIKSGDRNGFVFRNNGVTVVAKHINRTGDRFRVEDYQIVNGCQTSNILYQCADSVEGVSVPFRLIGTRNDEFITSIIVGTNSQNIVKEEQFWALKPFMKDLEEYFKQQVGDQKLYLERRENQYRNDSVERIRIIKPSDLMKSVAATYLFQPHRAARDFRRIRSEYSDTLFLNDHNVTPYHVACYSAYRFDYFVRNKRLPRSMNIYKYYILSALGHSNASGDNIFKVKNNKQNAICATILKIAEDEDRLIAFCRDTAAKVELLLEQKLGGSVQSTPRERIRDTLRSESFAVDFHS